MSRYLWLYSLLLFVGFTFNSFSASDTFDSEVVIAQTLIDSIPQDTLQVEPRQFEDLRDTYQGEEFVYERSIENSGWWSRFKQWLNDLIKSIFNLSSDVEVENAQDWIFAIAGSIIFLLVLFFIFKAVLNDEGSWVFGKSSDRSIIPITDIENNIHTTDFKQLISEAETENNYRLAIRYYYLWLLKGLTTAGIIDYDVEKTNSDYFNEINSKELKENFSYTSYLYNYIWYGEFDVNEQQFSKAKNAFTKLLNSIKA